MSTYNVSDAELEIMRVIWREGGRIYFAPLMECLDGMGKKWKTNTVLTFLSRLVEKGILTVEKLGRINQYVAVLTEEEYMESLAKSFVGKFFGGNVTNLMAALLRQDNLNAGDVAELKAFWEEKGGQNNE